MKPTEEKIHSSPSDLPVYLFKQGNNCEAYRYFGAHIEQRAGETGVVFRVWAPHAVAISVVGDFNSWKPGSHPMRKVDGDSVWELFIPGMKEYDVYKYCVTTRAGDLVLAQTAAFQFLLASQDDYDDAFARYLHLSQQGGEKLWTDLLAEAGFRSPFEPGALAQLAARVEPLIRKHTV